MSRFAFILAVPAWFGFFYVLLHRKLEMAMTDVSAAVVPEITWIAVGALAAACVAFACATARLRGHAGEASAWMLAGWCAVPFLGLVFLLHPLSAGVAL